MPFIDPAVLVGSGNPSIDAGHRAMAEAVNRLYVEWQEGKDKDILTGRLDELIGLSRAHFALEITILRAAEFKDWRAHDTDHRHHLARLKELSNLVRAAKGTDGFNVDLFMALDNMFFVHELDLDRAFWPHLRSLHEHRPFPPLIPWEPDLNVGIEVIDRQHRELVDLLNALYFCAVHETGSQRISQLLARIREAAVEHFRTEESHFSGALMGFPEAHVVEHRDLLRDLDALIASGIAAEPKRLADTIEKFLRLWALDHIRYQDKLLVTKLSLMDGDGYSAGPGSAETFPAPPPGPAGHK